MLWPLLGLATAPEWFVVVSTVADLVIRVVMLGVIPGNRRPTTAMAWLLGIFFIPTLGLVLFLLFGNFRLSRRRREYQADVNRRVLASTEAIALAVPPYQGPEWINSVVGP